MNRFKLVLLAFANIAYWLFLGPAMISAKSWVLVAIGVTAGVAILYYNWIAVSDAIRSLKNSEKSK
jgi:hypothetical protein